MLSCFKDIYIVTGIQNKTIKKSIYIYFFLLNLTIKMTCIGPAQNIIKVCTNTTLERILKRHLMFNKAAYI